MSCSRKVNKMQYPIHNDIIEIQHKYSANTIQIQRERECQCKDKADLTEEQLAIDTFTPSSSNQIHITTEIQIQQKYNKIQHKHNTNEMQKQAIGD